MKKATPARQTFARFIFLIYSLALLWLLFGRSFNWDNSSSYKEILSNNINLTPFYTISNYLQVVIYRTNDAVFVHCLINLVGNILLFIPIGYLIPKLWKKMRNFFLFIFCALSSIFIVEILQLFTLLGSFDVDDIILNFIGMFIGYLGCIVKKTI